MSQKIAERLVWAADTLAVQPDDCLLEIGCGHGLVVSLICDRLTRGKITAIDRSATMIDVAMKKNTACVAAGRAAFHILSLHEADFGAERFNKIFAIHVNVFWQKPTTEFAVIKKHLMPDGALYLFFQPLVEEQTQKLIDQLTENARRNDFSVKHVIFNQLQPLPGFCLVAQPA